MRSNNNSKSHIDWNKLIQIVKLHIISSAFYEHSIFFSSLVAFFFCFCFIFNFISLTSKFHVIMLCSLLPFDSPICALRLLMFDGEGRGELINLIYAILCFMLRFGRTWKKLKCLSPRFVLMLFEWSSQGWRLKTFRANICDNIKSLKSLFVSFCCSREYFLVIYNLIFMSAIKF